MRVGPTAAIERPEAPIQGGWALPWLITQTQAVAQTPSPTVIPENGAVPPQISPQEGLRVAISP